MLDKHGRFVRLNRTVPSDLGYDFETLSARGLEALVPAGELSVKERIRRAYEHGQEAPVTLILRTGARYRTSCAPPA